jgi:thiol-disulfide isomerase/thioredoxin
MRLKRSFAALLLFSLSLTTGAAPRASYKETPDTPENRSMTKTMQDGTRVRAPELAGARGWLNTDSPLSLAALRGKVVLLDFWTYGCINCIHIIPDLKKLEAKYANNLVVIGVHSAKFDNEKDTENIRRIILRYEIEHPVANDADFKIWNAYAVRAWPTQVLIDPAGYVIGAISGEGNYETLDKTIGETVAAFRQRGELNERPLKLALERAKVGNLPLAFPGKVLADEKSDRLFIADSNHNRIVVTTLDGSLVDTIGAGAAGSSDGNYTQAKFNRPQGMALDVDKLYVADTENHLIRRIDLRAKTVTTIAGTGAQSYEREPQGKGRAVALSSPWDLQLVGRTLYIASAGTHQIWQMNLDDTSVTRFAGSGREAREDGAPEEAGFAQPSGLASDGKTLFVADSESNIIRAIDLTTGETRTLAGGDLFDFGDKDATGDAARFQHPLGVFFAKDRIFIADTYNHKLKTLDPASGDARTFIGTGRAGQQDTIVSNGNQSVAQNTNASFYEPAGLSAAAGKIYVADTNNNAVRVVDLQTKQTRTLQIKGLTAPVAARMEESAGNDQPNAEEISLGKQSLAANANSELLIDVNLPAGYHLNADVPQRLRANIEQGSTSLSFAAAPSVPATPTRGDTPRAISNGSSRDVATYTQASRDLRLPVRVPLRATNAGAGQLRVALTVFYCREDNTGTCKIKTLVWRVPFEVTTGQQAATREIKLQAAIKD